MGFTDTYPLFSYITPTCMGSYILPLCIPSPCLNPFLPILYYTLMRVLLIVVLEYLPTHTDCDVITLITLFCKVMISPQCAAWRVRCRCQQLDTLAGCAQAAHPPYHTVVGKG
jgi:hypothetical protein